LNQIKKLAGQTLIYGLSTMLGRFLNYLLVMVHTVALKPFLYGKLTYFYGSTAILLAVLTFGMETGFFRFASKKDENYSKVLGTSLFTVFFTSLLFILSTFLFRNLWKTYFEVDNYRIIIFFVLIISFDALSAIPFAKLRIDERPLKFMFIKLTGIAINIFINLFYLVLCRKLYESGNTSFFAQIYNPQLALEYVLIANLIGSGITLLILLPDIIKVKTIFDLRVFKKLLNYSYPILLIGLAGMLNDNIDKILIPKLINDPNPMAQLGIYGANFKLSVLMVLFIQMFRYAAEPFFFKNSESIDAKKLYADVMNYFVIFGLIIFLGVMFYIDIFKYFIAEEFRVGLHVVPILLIAKLIFGIVFSLSIWYKVTDKTYYGIIVAGIGAIITIVLNVILIPVIGYVGSAYASLCSYTVMLVVSYYLSKKHYLIQYNFKKLAIYFILAIALYLLSIFIKFNTNNIYLIFNTLLLVFFIGFAYIKEKKSFKYEN